eukprot:TRINITY_DN4540_c0_g1_i1.p1 TRINITY_DN4540_c0_g1~~TRINITY_DN4540_c0_g1_i1.p1  ORF type:complete len:679 (-),score=193.10 TRINITY_DN4540_c0_g1_i1:25-2061(-)
MQGKGGNGFDSYIDKAVSRDQRNATWKDEFLEDPHRQFLPPPTHHHHPDFHNNERNLVEEFMARQQFDPRIAPFPPQHMNPEMLADLHSSAPNTLTSDFLQAKYSNIEGNFTDEEKKVMSHRHRILESHLKHNFQDENNIQTPSHEQHVSSLLQQLDINKPNSTTNSSPSPSRTWLQEFNNSSKELDEQAFDNAWRNTTTSSRPPTHQVQVSTTSTESTLVNNFLEEEKKLNQNQSELQENESITFQQYQNYLKQLDDGEMNISPSGAIHGVNPTTTKLTTKSLVEQYLSDQSTSNDEYTKWTQEYMEKESELENQELLWNELRNMEKMMNGGSGGGDLEDLLGDQFKSIWERIGDQINKPYQFQKNNIYLNSSSDPYSIGLEKLESGQLSQAILAFEAALQRPQKSEQITSNVWYRLGLAHAENEDDFNAILALNPSVELSKKLGDLDLKKVTALAISCTNEFQVAQVHSSFQSWFSSYPQFKHLSYPLEDFEKEGSEIVNQDRTIEAFRKTIKIIESSTTPSNKSENDSLLGDIYVALGTLNSLSSEYGKAAECFKMALSYNPKDYQLWNKLGASTANSEEKLTKEAYQQALDAYYRALEVRPTYTRARSNLGILYSRIGNDTEAAKCFLGALLLNPSNQSLWISLEDTLKDMNRVDLLRLLDQRNVELFRPHFDF